MTNYIEFTYELVPKIVLENNRQDFYIFEWSNQKDLNKTQILRISKNKTEGCFTLAELGITKGELSFEWFL